MNLNFTFKSSDHMRYQNGILVSGPHLGAKRAIVVEPNTDGGEGVSVTAYNLDGIHPIWRNNVQMATKPMKVISYDGSIVVLRGFGYANNPISGCPIFEAPHSDYGLTVKYKNNEVIECILHLHDRGVDIKYLK